MNDETFGFFNQDYDEKELGDGFAAGTAAQQWALAQIEEAKVTQGQNTGTHGVEMVLRLDKTHAKSRGIKVPFTRVWASTKPGKNNDNAGWRMFSRFCANTGLGAVTLPPTQDNAEKVVKAAASGLKGRKFVAWLGTEPDNNGIERFKLQDYYPATEENVKAIAEAGYDFRGVVVKKREENGKKKSYLAAKEKADEEKTGAASSSSSGSIE